MNESNDAFGRARLYFDWLDYSLFGMMLAVSSLIGVYFGCFGSRQKTAIDYLLGGRTMAVFPVAVSLIASSVSAITIMGVPAEIYMHGSVYWLVCLASVFMGIVVNYVYLPVFFNLQVTTTYEYLEIRFNQNVRKMASVMYTIFMLLTVPIVVYVPALAFSHVSGLSLHLISPVVCIVCIFYTMLGGMRAVIWTDFIQGFLIVGSGLLVSILGVINVGGLGVVWQRSTDGGRTQIANFDPSPLNRDTVWTVVIGLTFIWIANAGVNQGYVQKFLSMKDLKSAKKSLTIYIAGMIVVNSICCFTGVVIFATYYNCDPLTTKAIQRPDQLLPFFVMDTATGIPGLPGIFIAGVFSAALSTMSTNLNSLSATIFEDFVQPCLKDKVLESRANIIMKLIVVVVGAFCVLMVFVVEQLGAVLELSYSVGAITSGALLGLFSLGMFFPWANVKGAMAGSISSLVFVGWLVIGAQNALKTGAMKTTTLPTSVDGCDYMFNATIIANSTLTSTSSSNRDEPFVLYRIAFYYFVLIGTLFVIVVGLIVSFITGPRDPSEMNAKLFVPFIHKFITFKKEPLLSIELLKTTNPLAKTSNGNEDC